VTESKSCYRFAWLSAVLAGALAAGCGGTQEPTRPAAGPPQAGGDGKKYLLTAEPAGARPVKDVRQDAKDGEDVVMVGHIGGAKKPWVEGRASFLVVDPSVKPCPPEEGCKTPWDCCCEPREELLKVMATVKIVDSQGQTVATDARQLLGVKESQTVVVRGKAKRDEHGNLTVLADGVFVR
jgi:hypothetical protein